MPRGLLLVAGVPAGWPILVVFVCLCVCVFACHVIGPLLLVLLYIIIENPFSRFVVI